MQKHHFATVACVNFTIGSRPCLPHRMTRNSHEIYWKNLTRYAFREKASRSTSPSTRPHLDQPVDVHKYRVLSKGNENSIVMTTEPASERGQILLMKGRDLWIFMPSVSQPVRLSLSQRLTGQVANGDLARANFQW